MSGRSSRRSFASLTTNGQTLKAGGPEAPDVELQQDREFWGRNITEQMVSCLIESAFYRASACAAFDGARQLPGRRGTADLGECPLWNGDASQLLFMDCRKGFVYRMDPENGESLILPS